MYDNYTHAFIKILCQSDDNYTHAFIKILCQSVRKTSNKVCLLVPNV